MYVEVYHSPNTSSSNVSTNLEVNSKIFNPVSKKIYPLQQIIYPCLFKELSFIAKSQLILLSVQVRNHCIIIIGNYNEPILHKQATMTKISLLRLEITKIIFRLKPPPVIIYYQCCKFSKMGSNSCNTISGLICLMQCSSLLHPYSQPGRLCSG